MIDHGICCISLRISKVWNASSRLASVYQESQSILSSYLRNSFNVSSVRRARHSFDQSFSFFSPSLHWQDSPAPQQ